MADDLREFEDRYGDTLEISKEYGTFVSLVATEGDVTANLEFDLDVAHELAEFIADRELSTDHPKASSLSLNEAILRLATIHERRVTFWYKKDDTDVEKRTLYPERLEGGSVFGKDVDRNAPRSFRLDRISGDVTLVAGA